MYIGFATKCARVPLMAMFVTDRTAAKFDDVILPSEVVIAVLYVTRLPS
jgi:hypothetical protein